MIYNFDSYVFDCSFKKLRCDGLVVDKFSLVELLKKYVSYWKYLYSYDTASYSDLYSDFEDFLSEKGS